jgi:hypothetical protein
MWGTWTVQPDLIYQPVMERGWSNRVDSCSRYWAIGSERADVGSYAPGASQGRSLRVDLPMATGVATSSCVIRGAGSLAAMDNILMQRPCLATAFGRSTRPRRRRPATNDAYIVCL